MLWGVGTSKKPAVRKIKKTRCKSCWLLKKIKWKIKQSLKEMNN
ncbi:hypothetical protein AWRI1631_43840 [Saccharomyces cerevisiae AWRI1631]|uniref:Uncharacterized protein n=1 Tax=Saccharomyces cerevisiae (strain AWRI1631) TaxID=545124 RepID=B5VG58_YEAS6|nr:hypothetical protein AWRI1631_43840 [Saccharomyces cerevisiae AWRI1631]